VTYLLDTCVLSEDTKRRPDPRVASWLKHQSAVFVSAISLVEIGFGIRRMPAGKRRAGFERWFQATLMPSVRPGLVDVDEDIALRCAELIVEKPNAEVPDALIAATALVHDLVVATRNVRHFTFAGLNVVNPWEP
jgi:predicted nucleic acid-binding protein